MNRLASSLASKVRVAKNIIRPAKNSIRLVGSRLSWGRNYVSGSEEIPYNGKLMNWPIRLAAFKHNSGGFRSQACHRVAAVADRDVTGEGFATVGKIAKCGHKTDANLACDTVEEGVWLTALGYSDERGEGFDSQVLKYRPILTYTLDDALRSEGFEAVKAGMSADLIIQEIYEAVWRVCQYLRRIARPVSGYGEIVQVATAAANGDKKTGEWVAKAVEKLGIGGLFFLDSLRNPFILIHANKILTEDVVKQAIRPRRPLLIVAEDVETELVRSLRRSYRGKSKKLVLLIWVYELKLCVVKPPKCEHNGKAIMQDLAVFTGGEVVTGESDMNFVPQMLGSCKEVKVSQDEMVIVGGSGGQEDIEERRKELKFSIMSSTSNDELKLLEKRLAKFSCEVAYFKVGGDSCAEVFKYCCRVYNAITASLAALDGGIVAGGGVALLHASKELEKLHTSWYNEKKKRNNRMLGVHLVQKALKAPVCSIAHAAGFDYSVVVEKLLEQDNPDLGYDPAKGEFIDLIECGNVDAALLLSSQTLKRCRPFSIFHFPFYVTVISTKLICLELQSSKGTQTEKEACDLANECSLA
ncbi:Chaperonin CPN60-1 [Citrus sinensis]|uniref:Chaperonin CPN60-1 n=1 Tax=Citrus sinensis TaxID=2711 RepID=A0ACB8KDF2_CITSI|nr:Chaperonin CPN60-1 [Citrus sinensis]